MKKSGLWPIPGFLALLCLLSGMLLGACSAAPSSSALAGSEVIRARIDEADALWQAGNTAAARELLLPLVRGNLPQLRALRLLSRMARGEGNAHEALVWLDRADPAVLELSLLCMDRSRILWELEGGPLALEDIGLSLALLERIASRADPSWQQLGALRDMALTLESAYSGGLDGTPQGSGDE